MGDDILEMITIIRTAVGCLSAVALIYELKRAKVKVVGTDCNPLSAGLYLCDKSYVVPRGEDPTFIEEILKICKVEKPIAIISGPEEELLTLSRNKRIFNELDILLLCPDHKTIKICADKLLTYKTFKKLNVPTPKIYNLENVEFPCIVKPRHGRGGREVYKAENPDELHLHLKKIKNPIIQEFVNGVEYTVDTFADLNGNPLSVVPRARLQTESGISIKGVTVHDAEIIEQCKKMVKKLKLIGPACFQCLKENDGEIKFIEINPRFGGGSILSIKADPTIIPNLIRIIKGEPPSPSAGFREGLVMLRFYSEVFLLESNLLRKQFEIEDSDKVKCL